MAKHIVLMLQVVIEGFSARDGTKWKAEAESTSRINEKEDCNIFSLLFFLYGGREKKKTFNFYS